MTVVRDLTQAERDEAAFLARRVAKIEGPSDFTTSCEELAKNGWLTRGQLDCLRKKIKTAKPWHQPRQSLNRGHSKRPITLPKISV